MEKIILLLFAIMGIILAINLARSWVTSGEFFGTPAINTALFYSGKACNIGLWAALTLQAAGFDLSPFGVPVPCVYTGFITFIAGAVYVIASFLSQGIHLRFGLSESIHLRKTGIYGISRNPMYVGFWLLDLAAILYTANPLFIIPFIIALYSHHQIVLAEELFLRDRCGDEWRSYTARVRRYV